MYDILIRINMRKIKKHHGEILLAAINKSHFTKAKIARLLNFSQRHMYNYFAKPELPMDVFVKIGNIIGYDFSLDIPAIANYRIMTEPQVVSDENKMYQKKYFELLEKHIQLIEELNALKNKGII